MAFVEVGIKLSYLALGDTKFPPVIFLPGIMGNKKNLEHFVKKLLEKLPETSALIFDLRNHGESSKHCEPFTVEACAKDVAEAIKVLELKPKAVIGHSFGGKVALLVASMLKLSQVWLLDCPLGKITAKPLNKSLNVLEILEKLDKVSWPLNARNELVIKLQDLGVSREIALWMTTNLRQEHDGLYLNFYPKDMKKMLLDFLDLDLWPKAQSLSEHTQIHLVKAEHGERLDPVDQQKFEALIKCGKFHILKDSGHFVHADNPAGLLDIIISGLKNA